MLLSDHGFEAGHQKHRGRVLSGTHKSDAAMDGIFLASGGPFRRGVRLEQVSIRDIASTTLHLLGLRVPELLEGVNCRRRERQQQREPEQAGQQAHLARSLRARAGERQLRRGYIE